MRIVLLIALAWALLDVLLVVCWARYCRNTATVQLRTGEVEPPYEGRHVG